MNSIVSEKRYISSKLGVPYESLSQSYLRAESELGTQSVIDFTLQTNKVLAPTVTERLLDLNDEFVITHFKVALKKVVDDAELPLAERQQWTQLQTYESNSSITQMNPLGAIYNADLNFTIDRTEFIPNFPVRAFYRVPDMTEVLANTYAFGGTTNVAVPALDDNFSFAGGGQWLAQTETGLFSFYPSEPTKIDGRQTLDLTINLGANVPMGATGEGKNYAVFEARGYLITNAND